MKSVAAAVGALALSLPISAHASCKDVGSATAKAVFYYSADETVLDGIDTSLKLGLEPSSFPAQYIQKAAPSCTREDFSALGVSWTLRGDDDGQPPRWARVGEDNSRVMFLAAMPRAADAEAWVVAQRKSPNHPSTAKFPSMMFALVLADGDQRQIDGFYEFDPARQSPDR